jgi:DNA-binding CsgD family transcriptional regulator
VPALATRDAERLLDFVAEAERIGGDQPFTPELLVGLGELVHADWITYNELDHVRRRSLLEVARLGDEEDDPADPASIFWTIVVEEHPICVRHQQGDFRALKLSDFVTARQLHKLRVYDVWLRPYSVERELNVALPSPLWHTKSFIFDRGAGRDFTERDRLVLDRLQPHLARLWRAARTRRLLGSAMAALDQADEHDARGVILLGAAGEIEFASPPSNRLLREYFPPAPADHAPLLIVDWLASGAGRPLVRRLDGRRLTIEEADGALLLEERHDEVDLTPREREILSWVGRGKTNAEIAELLWLAPSTVRKHLENVYAKLGVRSRTAAVTRFLGLIGEEDQEKRTPA